MENINKKLKTTATQVLSHKTNLLISSFRCASPISYKRLTNMYKIILLSELTVRIIMLQLKPIGRVNSSAKQRAPVAPQKW